MKRLTQALIITALALIVAGSMPAQIHAGFIGGIFEPVTIGAGQEIKVCSTLLVEGGTHPVRWEFYAVEDPTTVVDSVNLNLPPNSGQCAIVSPPAGSNIIGVLVGVTNDPEAYGIVSGSLGIHSMQITTAGGAVHVASVRSTSLWTNVD